MDSKSNQTKSNASTPTGTLKKKKRCRVRNRPRNKCNRKPAEADIVTNIKYLAEKSSETPEIILVSSKANKEVNDNSKVDIKAVEMQSTNTAPAAATATAASNTREKTREEIMAEREAKKLAKQAKKTKPPVTVDPTTTVAVNKPTQVTPTPTTNVGPNKPTQVTSNPKPVAAIATVNVDKDSTSTEKSRDQIKAEREAKKQAKQAAKVAKASKDDASLGVVTQQLENLHITDNAKPTPPSSNAVETDIKKKPALTKAERRALQESQRAAKAQAQVQAQAKKTSVKPSAVVSKPQQKSPTAVNSIENAKTNLPAKASPTSTKSKECKVKLFNHLECSQKNVSLFINNAQIHPSIARLGEQYAKRTVVGSNARCIAFLNALKMVIQDFETPPKKEFARSLEVAVKVSVDHLQKCRPLAVSVSNAYKHIKHILTQLPTDKPESELKEDLCHFIETYIENQIGKAAQAISSKMQEKIHNGDVILTFGCSSLINYICEEAHKRKVDFRVIVVDSRPFCEGQELLRRLMAKEIPCTYVLINAVGFVMPEVTKVLLGAHALLSNGYVMARTGTAQVALVANSFNVPVLVCCETHKFSERFQTDAIVYNELGDPHDLVLNEKCCLTNWQTKNKMSPLNLIYDVTPPELVTAVVTEVSVLPCTSVPVILRIKPTEIGYYS